MAVERGRHGQEAVDSPCHSVIFRVYQVLRHKIPSISDKLLCCFVVGSNLRMTPVYVLFINWPLVFALCFRLKKVE